MHRKNRIILCLALALTVSACAGKKADNNPTPDSPLRQVAVQTDRAANALNATVDLKRALLREGLITQAQSNALTARLLSAVSLVREINETAASVNDLNEGKARLTDLVRQLKDSFSSLTASLAPDFNATARERITKALEVAVVAIAALEPILGGVR